MQHDRRARSSGARDARFRPALATVVVAAVSLALAACSGTPSSPGPTSPLVATMPASGGPTPGPAASAVATVAPPSAGPLGARLLGSIDVDAGPCAVAADATSAWVTGYGAGRVDRIDLASHAISARIDVGSQPCGIDVGPDGRVWVAVLGASKVVAIDPDSGRITAEIDNLSASLWDLKAGLGAVWVTDRTNGVVLRIDPATAKVGSRIPIGPMGAGLAIVAGAVWVADAADGTIRRIDPATNLATVTATLPGGAIWFADDGASQLAVSSASGKALTVIDPTTGAAGAAIGGWVVARDGTVVGSTGWEPDGRAAAVRLVDLGTGAITASFALPGSRNPFVAEPVAKELWVLDYGSTTIWRLQP